MKIKFIGVPGESHQSLNMFGAAFPLGEWTKVVNPNAIRKLSNHPHFESKSEASDEVEDAAIKGEFVALLDAPLAVAEAEHVEHLAAEQEQASINAASDELAESVVEPMSAERFQKEQDHGNPQGLGDQSLAEDRSPVVRGRGKPGRPAKGS